MGWLSKTVPAEGMVAFADASAPRPEQFAFLQKLGLEVKPSEPPCGSRWALRLRHPEWGKALLHLPDDFPPPPGEWIDFDARLSEEEKERAKTARSMLRLTREPGKGNVLRDRKSLLRFMGAVMGTSGVFAGDMLSLRIWSRAALDDELCHDADPDIEALYTLHVVGDEAGERPVWLHTHGLAEIGYFDFDVLEPHQNLLGIHADAVRAIAYAVVEGAVTGNTPDWALAEPGGHVRFVDVVDFMRKADPRHAAMRAGSEREHTDDRSVVCEPTGFVSRLFGDKPAPSRFLCREWGEDGLITFSPAATEQMGERARGTYGMFRRLAEEMAEFEFTLIAKIGYEIDGATDAGEREHLWFEVHGLHDGELDATLESEPIHIARMQKGQRGRHPVSRLSDWAIMTPAGMINPRNTAPARMIRERREELLRMKREYESGAAGD